MLDTSTKAVVYGRHLDMITRMLCFDFLSGRDSSVAAVIDPGVARRSYAKVFFWEREIMIPVFRDFSGLPDDMRDMVLINFASHRSAPDVARAAMASGRFFLQHIVAEGIPEHETRLLIHEAKNRNVMLLGPATVGGIAAGAFRIGNTGGSLENIVASRLYRPGSVGFVSRSGGMSNELYRVLSRTTDGVHTGFALGGDRYVGMRFSDAVEYFEKIPEIRMIVILGEVGGTDELAVAEAIGTGKITKPVVAWIAGTFAEHLPHEVQFGHAWAKANRHLETAREKNRILREAGAFVPESYAGIESLIRDVYEAAGGVWFACDEPTDAIDAAIARLQHRRPTTFTSTICDERSVPVRYDGVPVSDFLSQWGLARVIGHLWLRRELPEYALRFIETVLILLADHGPAVSGATNTIITARAGKDIVSSLIAGLATIGPRFGGAIDASARTWYECVRDSISTADLITKMRRKGEYIPGIGHRLYSKFRPDDRVARLTDCVHELRQSRHLDFARAVEALTLEKKPNLILNVDGAIAAILLDIFGDIGMTRDEIETALDSGVFNAFFILARTIGLLWHAIDQRRLGEGLYRTAHDDIFYLDPSWSNSQNDV